ncbi:MAG: SDR family oxidoreductase [Bacteroidota bacterium]|nr:SDR family oxidoreductase [Bacteroidota bacterium]
MSKSIIIGGTSGIGAQICAQLEKQNAEFIFTGTKESVSEYNLPFKNHKYFQFNALNSDNGQLPEIESVSSIFYCPGTISLKPFNRLTEDDFLNDYKVNVLGAVKVLQKYINTLKTTPNASIVLFSTVAVAQGMAFHTSISASKGAIETLTRSLAAELAPHIRVNCIALSLTDTPLAEKLLNTEEKKASASKRHPLQAYGNPSDIAELALFLSSDASKWITGQVIHADGGLSTLRV